MEISSDSKIPKIQKIKMKTQGFLDFHPRNPKNPNENTRFGDPCRRTPCDFTGIAAPSSLSRSLSFFLSLSLSPSLSLSLSLCLSVPDRKRKRERSRRVRSNRNISIWKRRMRRRRTHNRRGEGKRKLRGDKTTVKRKEGDEWALGGGCPYIYIYTHTQGCIGASRHALWSFKLTLQAE